MLGYIWMGSRKAKEKNTKPSFHPRHDLLVTDWDLHCGGGGECQVVENFWIQVPGDPQSTGLGRKGYEDGESYEDLKKI